MIVVVAVVVEGGSGRRVRIWSVVAAVGGALEEDGHRRTNCPLRKWDGCPLSG
ncbi:hypothetical protein Hanom_Chr03g00269991 [Helianthus anomalus]